MKTLAQGGVAAAITLAAFAPAAAQADFLGFVVGAYHWQQEWNGTARNQAEVNLRDDLNYSDDTGNVFYVAFEHPIPLLPNIKLQQSEIEISGRADGFSYSGLAFPAGAKTTTDLSHTDATLYYELLDNIVSLDLGLTARRFDGSFTASGSTGFIPSPSLYKTDIDDTVPLVYASFRADLPLTGLHATFEGNGIKFEGDQIFDYTAKIAYESSLGLGAELGIRDMDIQYDNGRDDIDITVDGAFLGVFYHF